VCPNDAMGSDFSALDAELDALGTGVSGDALALAASHGFGAEALPARPALSAIDEALTQLGQDVPSVDLHVIANQRPLPDLTQPHSRAPASEEIVLPEPVLRDFGAALADQSGELPLDAHRSGSFPLPEPAFDGSGAHAEDQVLLDAELDELLEMTAESSLLGDGSQVHDTDPPGSAARDGAAHAAFEALFAEATGRRSSLPSARFSHAPAPLDDDTDTFDSSILAFAEESQNGVPVLDDSLTETFNVDELDSAEFQIMPSANDSRPSSPAFASSQPPPASEAPEKRPSFLGRLFGRKED
jgi:hypothetical protein